MSQYARLSIWENHPGDLSWYDHVVGRKMPGEPFITPNTNIGLITEDTTWAENDSPQDLFAYQDAWFSELKAHDRNKKSCALKQCSPRPTAVSNYPPLGTVDEGPTLDPYFEYMFADAEIGNGSGCSGNSIDDLSFGKASDDTYDSFTDVLDLSSPPVSQPATPEPVDMEPQVLDVCMLDANVFEQPETTIAALANVSHQVADTKSRLQCLADGTIEAAHLETEHANIGFFETTPALESSVCFDTTPLVDQDFHPKSGPPWPVAPRKCQEHDSRLPFLLKDELNGLVARAMKRRILKPRSPRRCGRSKITSTNTKAVQNLSITPKDLRTVTKKRCADRSFNDAATKHSAAIKELCSKKARLHLKSDNQQVALRNSVGTILSTVNSFHRPSGDFFNHKPLAVVPRGYAGQFDGMIIRDNLYADFKYTFNDLHKYRSEMPYTFGDGRHPNGIVTHSSIKFDPLYKVQDFTKENLPTGHPLFKCMSFATEMTIAATHNNVVELRSHDEEILRREAHIECAHARLEGVAVGFYRYYQGHLSIEEYHQAEMCVC